jgi:hypothetical protein
MQRQIDQQVPHPRAQRRRDIDHPRSDRCVGPIDTASSADGALTVTVVRLTVLSAGWAAVPGAVLRPAVGMDQQ